MRVTCLLSQTECVICEECVVEPAMEFTQKKGAIIFRIVD